MQNFRNPKKQNLYDLIIIGAGPAGLSAALYALRYRLKTLIIAKNLGGNLINIPEVSNYPSQETLQGPELAQKFIDKIKNKIEIIKEEAVKVFRKKGEFLVKTGRNNFKSRTVILALGALRKKLHIPGEKEFDKKGVAYCAICEAPVFRNKKVVVAGGGNAALYAALLVSKYAREVIVLARRKLRADPVVIEEALKNKKIKIEKGISIKEIQGNVFVERVVLSRKLKGKKTLGVQGVFIEIGFEPDTEIVNKFELKKDKQGFLKIGEDMETSTPGLYAVGDISTGSDNLRQIITASSEGVIAATSVYNKLKG